ncbi:glycosyltransferase [Pyrococcus kukulkanii]|uniref:glycosyltransferase n=1 Tax=Pyrococcus kukulkanii TaxID=1609559 RepID=UPI003564D6B5
MLVSIVVPTYNEADNLPLLVERLDRGLRDAGYEYEVLVMDDKSPDGTYEVAKKLAGKYPVRPFLREGPKGLSPAVVDGFREARGDVIVVMDADLQHPPELVPELVGKVLEGYDIVIGSRYVEGGRIENWKWYRRLVSLGAVLFVRVFLPRLKGIKDPVSGFFAVRREVVEECLDRLNPLGFKILLELLVKAKYERVAEVPIVFRERVHGKSKLGAKTILEMVIHTLKLARYSGDLLRAVKFAVVGASGVFVYLGSAKLLYGLIGGPWIVSLLLAFEVSVLSNFVLNDLWTYRDARGKGFWRRFFGFHKASYVGGVVQIAVHDLLMGVVGWVLAGLIGVGLGYLVRYFLTNWEYF